VLFASQRFVVHDATAELSSFNLSQGNVREDTSDLKERGKREEELPHAHLTEELEELPHIRMPSRPSWIASSSAGLSRCRMFRSTPPFRFNTAPPQSSSISEHYCDRTATASMSRR
jgi:hypothetical protein